MTSTEVEMTKLADKEKDRRHQRQMNDKTVAGKFFGDALKTVGSWIPKAHANDPAWYKMLPGEIVPATSIPDFMPHGTEDSSLRNTGVNVPSVIRINYAPTIGNTHNLMVGQKVGLELAGTDPMNKAINRVCTQLESRLARVAQYTRDTVGRYLFISTDIACQLMRIKTAIDVFTVAEATNPFLSRKLIRALGFNYKDFKDNISAYRMVYASMAADYNAGIPLPMDLSFVKRQVYLSSIIVKDSSTKYASYLIFNRAVLFRFPDPNYIGEDPSWSRAHPDYYMSRRLPVDGFSFNGTIQSSLVECIKHNINKLVNGATWKPLIRDLRGGTKENTWLQLNADVTRVDIKITDLDEVREQLHNLNTIPAIMFNSDNECKGLVWSSFSIGGNAYEAVVQDALYGGDNIGTGGVNRLLPAGSIIYSDGSFAQAYADNVVDLFTNMFGDDAEFIDGKSYKFHNRILGHKDNLSADDCLVYTRLKANFTMESLRILASSGAKFEIDAEIATLSTTANGYLPVLYPSQFATELVLSLQILEDAPDTTSYNYNAVVTACFVQDDNSYLGLFFNPTTHSVFYSTLIAGYSGVTLDGDKFLKSFGMYSTIDWLPPAEVVVSGIHEYIGEIDHYTTLEPEVLGKLHMQCVESEFTIPVATYLSPIK